MAVAIVPSISNNIKSFARGIWTEPRLLFETECNVKGSIYSKNYLIILFQMLGGMGNMILSKGTHEIITVIISL